MAQTMAFMRCKSANVRNLMGFSFQVDTGIRDVNLRGKVYSFRGMKSKLSNKFWYNDTARLINGTGWA